jgi:hypothetical protein
MCWRFANTGILAALLSMVLAACGAPEASPEQEVRDLLSAVVEAAEARSVREVGGFVHEHYSDRRHPDKAAAMRSLYAYLARHRGIHLFHLTKDVGVSPDGTGAQAVVYVAMTGVPIDSVETLVSLKADLYRFDVDLVLDDGSWRVRHTRWRRADLAVL